MRITLIYDNDVWQEGLETDWGFACLVEVENTPKILFDTGASGGILLRNMEKLDIDPHSIEEVFISHAHGDHIGGLSDFLKVNKDVTLYVPASLGSLKGAKETVSVKGPMQIHENVFSTGELRGIEQSMAIKTEKGIVVIDGCSHPGVGPILEAAARFGKVYALVGGLHGFNKFDLLKGLKYVCACHCTQYKSEIKRLYPEKWLDGGAGRVLEF
ncbi:MAG: MBL fold metallo-hydrolase [Candidatus Bipolaricaulota bacterium]|nr:MBL fold metallo-hydrolase [Candidatus Bipolaricaulota bacterium]